MLIFPNFSAARIFLYSPHNASWDRQISKQQIISLCPTMLVSFSFGTRPNGYNHPNSGALCWEEQSSTFGFSTWIGMEFNRIPIEGREYRRKPIEGSKISAQETQNSSFLSGTNIKCMSPFKMSTGFQHYLLNSTYEVNLNYLWRANFENPPHIFSWLFK